MKNLLKAKSLQTGLGIKFYNGLLTLAVVGLLSGAPTVFAADNSSATSGATKNQAVQAYEKVSINKAGADELATVLKGIGEKKAQAIVAWRNTNGSFSSVDQLLEVKGIGPATLEKNRHRIVL